MEDPTFPLRLAIGVSLLAGLVLWDHVRGAGSCNRLQEYAFLLGSGCLGVCYALLHDLCTYALCADYFVVGKGLDGAAVGYWPDVAWLATRAGWSAGLVIGCVLLFANNPHPDREQLRYQRLAGTLLWPVGISLLLAISGAWIGPSLLESVVEPWTLRAVGVADPAAFLSTWGIHIGSYAGALVGLLVAAARVRRLRWNLQPDAVVP